MPERILYIAIMILATYLLRVLPFTLIRKPIKNRFFCSFLYYVPYVTLAVMTFPAIINAASPLAGAIAFVAGIIAAYCGLGLLPVAAVCCSLVFIAEWFIK